MKKLGKIVMTGKPMPEADAWIRERCEVADTRHEADLMIDQQDDAVLRRRLVMAIASSGDCLLSRRFVGQHFARR